MVDVLPVLKVNTPVVEEGVDVLIVQLDTISLIRANGSVIHALQVVIVVLDGRIPRPALEEPIRIVVPNLAVLIVLQGAIPVRDGVHAVVVRKVSIQEPDGVVVLLVKLEPILLDAEISVMGALLVNTQLLQVVGVVIALLDSTKTVLTNRDVRDVVQAT
jgi:hypothetical protein